MEDSSFSDKIIENSLLELTFKEVTGLTNLNKQYNKIITSNSFWCKMLQRDYNINNKNNCFNEYNKQVSLWKAKLIFVVFLNDKTNMKAIFKDYDNSVLYGKELKKESKYSDDIVNIYAWQQGVNLGKCKAILTIDETGLNINKEEYDKINIYQKIDVNNVFILKIQLPIIWYEKKADAEVFRNKNELMVPYKFSDELFE